MNRIQLNIRMLRRFPSRDCYLVGVSGGRDSVVLLQLLVDLGYKNLVVCHLNHQLRRRASDRDARFVEQLARDYSSKIVGQALRPAHLPIGKQRACRIRRDRNLDFELGTADVRALATEKKVSIETAAREARYAFFARVAKRRHCRTIFLAHHADDLVETFLLNLFRGAGITGLAAMRELSVRQIGDIELTIVRPLLSVWRTQIDDYTRKHRLKFREDASNKDLALARNRIRHRVIPYLERTLGREIRRSIWRAANIAAHEEAWIDWRMPKSSEADLAVAKLRELPIAPQRRAIVNWLRSRDIKNVGFDLVEAVRLLLEPDAGVAKINLPRDRHVRRRAGKIFVE